jgi:hypothetical protein
MGRTGTLARTGVARALVGSLPLGAVALGDASGRAR